MSIANELYHESPDPPDVNVPLKRSQSRRPNQEALELEIDGKVRKFIAEVRDVGTNSMGIISREPIRKDATIRVRRPAVDGPWNSAIVIHCTGTIGGYKVGLKILED